jgi:hypothetical protein
VIGVDPGRSNILFAVKLVDGKPVVYRLTRSHYYNKSGILKAQENTQQWTKSIAPELLLLSQHSGKGDSLDRFIAHLEVLLQVWDTLWTEYLHPKWANQRLRLYGGKKRVFAEFFNRLEAPGKKVIVAYGSAKFAPGGKNEVSVPTTRSYKECSYRFTTVPVDEFRSTIVFHGDKKTVLKKVRRRDTGREVRGLLWCDSTNQGKGKLINRDLNGALNIRDCFLLPKRPTMLQRKEGEKKLKRMFGRTIKC